MPRLLSTKKSDENPDISKDCDSASEAIPREQVCVQESWVHEHIQMGNIFLYYSGVREKVDTIVAFDQ